MFVDDWFLLEGCIPAVGQLGWDRLGMVRLLQMSLGDVAPTFVARDSQTAAPPLRLA